MNSKYSKSDKKKIKTKVLILCSLPKFLVDTYFTILINTVDAKHFVKDKELSGWDIVIISLARN